MKVHAIKQLPGDRQISMCWNAKPDVVLAANEAEVTCKPCLKALAFNRAEAEEWAQRRAKKEGAK
jgi:hypothetical protein